MQNHKKNLEILEKELIEQGFLGDLLISFHKEIFDYQSKIYNIFAHKSFTPGFVKDNTLPLIDIDQISISPEVSVELKGSISSLCAIIKKYHKGFLDKDIIENISSSDNIVNLIRALLLNDTGKLSIAANDSGLGLEEFVYIIINWLKPFFTYLADGNKSKINHSKWSAPKCSFCGYYPDMAMIDDSTDGRRYLHCALCENEWPFDRISCLICDNKDSKKLGVYTMTDDTNLRIEYCKVCNGYIKTLKTSSSHEIDLTVLHITSIYLDKLAYEKGLARP